LESTAKKRARPRRSFTPQFKAGMCQRGDRPVRQVSQDFDLTGTAVRGQRWDKAVAGSFLSTITTEIVRRQAWPTHTAARQTIFECCP
jgi:hypothetical protein